eukprot:scaffold27044_cov165-Skeletonema_menzelii.AAC.1
MTQSAAEEITPSLSSRKRSNQELRGRRGCHGSSIRTWFFTTSMIKLGITTSMTMIKLGRTFDACRMAKIIAGRIELRCDAVEQKTETKVHRGCGYGLGLTRTFWGFDWKREAAIAMRIFA